MVYVNDLKHSAFETAFHVGTYYNITVTMLLLFQLSMTARTFAIK